MRSCVVALALALSTGACTNSLLEAERGAPANDASRAVVARRDRVSRCAGVAAETINGKTRRVRIEVAPCRVGPDETARMVLVNIGEATVGYGPSFALERRTAAGWRRINRRQGFPLPLLWLEPGDRSDPEPIAVYFSRPNPIELPPGLYRVTKGVDLTPGRPRPPTMVVSARFHVEG
jgi:hypothetical protein